MSATMMNDDDIDNYINNDNNEGAMKVLLKVATSFAGYFLKQTRLYAFCDAVCSKGQPASSDSRSQPPPLISFPLASTGFKAALSSSFSEELRKANFYYIPSRRAPSPFLMSVLFQSLLFCDCFQEKLAVVSQRQ